jgi:hypothetical protein
MKTFTATPDDVTLKRVPERAVVFLAALARRPDLRAHLAPLGFDAAAAAEGAALLTALLVPPAEAPVPLRPDAPTAAAALAQVAVDGRRWATRVRATLTARAPALGARLFAALPAEPVLALVAVLGRLRVLATDAEPETAAVLALLEARGLGLGAAQALETRLAALTGRSPAEPRVPAALQDAAVAEHRARRVALYLWYREWAEIARSALPRRHDLIALGLAAPRQGTRALAA